MALYLIDELNYSQIVATIIHANNQRCIALAYNPINHSHTKHINIKYYFIYKHIKCGEVKLKYVSTKEMLVDIFTRQVSHNVKIVDNGLDFYFSLFILFYVVLFLFLFFYF